MRKYFFEIKNRIYLILLLFISLLIVFYTYKELLLFFILKTTQTLNRSSECFYYYFIFTDVTEIFYVYFKLILFSSIQFTYLYAVYQILLFFSPAFFEAEYLFIKRTIVFSIVAWFFSSVFTCRYIIPVSWDFFLSFQSLNVNYSSNLYFEAKISEYVAFYFNMYFYCSIYSQTLVFIVILFNQYQKNIISIKKYRKIHIYSFILLSTFISPPDIFSQIVISFVFIFLYELSVFCLSFRVLLCKL